MLSTASEPGEYAATHSWPGLKVQILAWAWPLAELDNIIGSL